MPQSPWYRYGWTGEEWIALDRIGTADSHSNSCAWLPSTIECGYYGAFIESNSGAALTIAQASNDGSRGPPTNNTTFDIWPLMADHKTFSVINVNNGDSIQFTYTLTTQ